MNPGVEGEGGGRRQGDILGIIGERARSLVEFFEQADLGMLDINYYLRGAAGLLQKSRLATTSLPFSSSYAYRICIDNHILS